jgi:hypothetical protein
VLVARPVVGDLDVAEATSGSVLVARPSKAKTPTSTFVSPAPVV